ncbi:MAG: lipopolysaccharide biosynthesis protein [Phycisphaerae bacterium]|nr:lipopolysaccharide biosynthesis protein [Phycisphaerae bacterium]
MDNRDHEPAILDDPRVSTARTAARGEGAIGGATVIILARAVGGVTMFASLAIAARLLTPGDFGLVAMVYSVTALLMVFGDLGLSHVTVQRPEIGQEQLSTLFWVNIGFGLLLALVTVSLAPVLVWFYGQPRLMTLTIVLAAAFPLTALGVQHSALLKRHMKFRRVAVVRLTGMSAGAVACIASACLGWGYWALVCQALVTAWCESVAAWMAFRWRPGWPKRCGDLRAMLGFGGRLTAHGLIGYLSTNLDKVLLGRFCGAFALGLYATSFRLMTRCVSTIGMAEAAIASMSRSVGNPNDMRATYGKMIQFLGLLGMPLCVAGILWTEDIVLSLLGHQWGQAVVPLRLLFLAAIPKTLSATTGWVYISGGRPDRMLRWGLVWSPMVAVAFVAGLPWGAEGVAGAFAIAHWVGLVPCLAYCFRGTLYRLHDVLAATRCPLLCAGVACAVGVVSRVVLLPDLGPGPARLGFMFCLAAPTYIVAVAVSVPLVSDVVRGIGRRALRTSLATD